MSRQESIQSATCINAHQIILTCPTTRNSSRRMTIQARSGHNLVRSPNQPSSSPTLSATPREHLASRTWHCQVYPPCSLPQISYLRNSNSMHTVLEILPQKKCFFDVHQRVCGVFQDRVDADCAKVEKKIAANDGVGAYQSSRRCPCANSCPTGLLLTFGTSFVPLFTSTQRTPINFLLDRLQRLFAEHDDKLHVL